MKSTGNKKAQNFGRSGLIDVNNFRKVNMTTIQQNLLNPNNQPLIIGEFSIRQDEDGRYCLNDLHKASGDMRKDRPSYFLENEKTLELIQAINEENYDVGNSASSKQPVNIIRGRGKEQGTYVVKELVYSYAMWISAKFHLMVIRAYDSLVMQWRINDRQTITPEQQALLHEIVTRRSNGERKTFAEMWSRHNRHFKIPRYAELLAIHFPEAVHYLETMELKAKLEPKEPIKALPYPQEVIQVAQQINHEYKGGHYHSWFVHVRDDGQLSAMPLLKGYYPINLVEFAKKFDGLLEFVYGNELLTTGRYLASK